LLCVTVGADDFDVRLYAGRELTGAFPCGVQQAEACQVRHLERPFLFCTVLRDAAERIGADITEAFGIGGGPDAEGVEHEDDRSCHWWAVRFGGCRGCSGRMMVAFDLRLREGLGLWLPTIEETVTSQGRGCSCYGPYRRWARAPGVE